jgi:hypothetical protein
VTSPISPINLNVNVNQDPYRNTVTVDTETTDVTISLQGAQGQRGLGIISGNGDPTAADGRVGEYYINLTIGSFWGPKTVSGWPNDPFFIPGVALRHIHTQASPSSTWTIIHALGGYPSVTVVDSASTMVVGEVSYVSTSQIVVEFTAPFSGFAYLT